MPEHEEAYLDWIGLHVRGDGYAQCEEITLAMQKVFPELQRRKGLFQDAEWGRRTHWWLLDQNNEIIDPTASQHPSGDWFPDSDGLYTDMTDLSNVEIQKILPSGRCASCGGDIYGGRSTVCSDSCEVEFAASIAAELL